MTQFTAALLRVVRIGRLVRVVAEVRAAPEGDPAGVRALASAYRAAASVEPEVFTSAASALDDYAAALAAAQAEHAAARARRLPTRVRGSRRAHTAAILAADRLARRCGDLTSRARLAAGVIAGLTPADAHALAAVGRRGYDSGVLGPKHLRAAGARLTPARLDALRTASPLERAWLIKALAASEEGLAEFADAVRGKPPEWLATRLSLVDRHAPTAQTRMGAAVRQYEATTCGTTCLIVARAEHDPRYALAMTSGDFAAAFRAARASVHEETNRWYPQAAGTSPRGMATWLTRHLGVRHRWRLVNDRDPREVSMALRDVLAAVDDGHPVPVLVGAVVPRHYVLVVGHHDGSVLVFEPTAGVTVAVPDRAFLDGDLAAALGFAHLQAVVLPDQAGQPLSAGSAAFGSK